jgi:hypothetical protein
MRFLRSGGTCVAVLSLALGASSATDAIPARVAGAKIARSEFGVRSPRRVRTSVATPKPCATSFAGESFVGVNGDNDVAGGEASAVLGGQHNDTCGLASTIAGGTYNGIDYDGGFIGGGIGNAIAGANYSAIGSGNGNTITGYGSFIGAGFYNNAAGPGSVVGGGDSIYEQLTETRTMAAPQNDGNIASGVDSFVGAGDLNHASGAGSFLGAGGSAYANADATTVNNQVSGTDSFLGAGDQNSVAAFNAFLGGGLSNAIYNTGGGNGGGYGFIGGGYKNSIQPFVAGGGEYGVVAGGASNIVYGVAATIGGGSGNRANGEYATIPGGSQNNANGTASFAAGTGARAIHNGTFVWSDNASANTLQSTGNYQFLARASGGYTLYSNAAATIGVKLAAGSGAWASLSDRAAKTRVRSLDEADILAKVATLPISSWQYRSEDPKIRHLGPMAQDFYAAFGVGEDDRHITSIDEDGVALAAIKALHAENRRLHADNAGLNARVAALETEVRALVRGAR